MLWERSYRPKVVCSVHHASMPADSGSRQIEIPVDLTAKLAAGLWPMHQSFHTIQKAA